MSCFWLFYEIVIFCAAAQILERRVDKKNTPKTKRLSAASSRYLQNVINIQCISMQLQLEALASFWCRCLFQCWKRAWRDFCARVCRSFTTTHGAPTPVSHVTATRWVPSRGRATQSLGSASAGLALLAASATHATTHLLRSQIPAVRVRRLFTVTLSVHL